MSAEEKLGKMYKDASQKNDLLVLAMQRVEKEKVLLRDLNHYCISENDFHLISIHVAELL